MYKMKFSRMFFQFTRNCGQLVTEPKTVTKLSPKFVSEFFTYYPKLVDRVLSQNKYCEHEEANQRIRAVAKEYVMMKTPFQGEFLLYVYELLEKPENITEKKIEQGFILATLQEMFQGYFIIVDDVLDYGDERHNKPCWYLQPGSSKLAINDTSLLRSLTIEMLIQNIDEKYLPRILDLTNQAIKCMGSLLTLLLKTSMLYHDGNTVAGRLFHILAVCVIKDEVKRFILKRGISRTRDNMFYGTEISEYLDEIEKNFNNFTIETYTRVQNFKSSDYCMVLPIKMALILSDLASEESFKVVDDLCFDLGLMIQINNDFTEYLDYRNPFTGKTGTDIKRGICTWLALTALRHFNPEQRRIFEENYGKWDNECEKRIVKLYDEINMEKLFYKERETRYKRFLSKAEKLPSDAVPSTNIFRQILNFYRSYADDTTKYYFN